MPAPQTDAVSVGIDSLAGVSKRTDDTARPSTTSLSSTTPQLMHGRTLNVNIFSTRERERERVGLLTAHQHKNKTAFSNMIMLGSLYTV